MSGLQRNGLMLPMTLAAVVRIGLWSAVLLRTGTHGLLAGDTLSYLEPGRNLLLQGAFQTAGQVEIGRTPGYPLFLSLASLPGDAAASLLQVALSVLSVWLVARLAHATGLDPRGVILSAWLMALEPVAVVYSVRLLSEMLFCLLLLLSLERMAAFLQSHALQAVALSGAALAAAIFVRPAAYFLPLLWSLGLLAICWKQRGPQPSIWKTPALLLVTTLPFLALWQMRNFVETGFNGFSSVAVRNAYFYSAAELEARATGHDFLQVQRAFGYPDEASYLQSHPEQASWTQAARLNFMQQESRRILAEHWQTALLVHLEGSAVVAFSPCAAELLEMLGLDAASAPVRVLHQGPLLAARTIVRTQPLRAVLMALFECVLMALYLMAARGVARGGLAKHARLLLIGTAFYFIVISGGVQAVGRFRMPVMPIVCILAAAGLANFRKQAPAAD